MKLQDGCYYMLTNGEAAFATKEGKNYRLQVYTKADNVQIAYYFENGVPMYGEKISARCVVREIQEKVFVQIVKKEKSDKFDVSWDDIVVGDTVVLVTREGDRKFLVKTKNGKYWFKNLFSGYEYIAYSTLKESISWMKACGYILKSIS